jgi:phosphoglycolate phosphatase
VSAARPSAAGASAAGPSAAGASAAGPSAAGPRAAGPRAGGPRAGGLDLILFDLDGTITDSQSGISASYRHTVAELGLPVDESAIRSCIGPPLSWSLTSLGVPAERIPEAVKIWRAFFSVHGIFDNEVYAEVPAMLERLAGTGIPVGLATSKLQRYAVEILDHFGLRHYFDPIVGATADGRLTHKDEIVAEALAQTGIPGSDRVLMIGDREHDMWGAVQNGVVPIGVSYGYGTRTELEAAHARWIVDSPGALTALILTLADT